MSFPSNAVATIASLVNPVMADRRENSRERKTLALLALSHTSVEHELYMAMLHKAEYACMTDSLFSLQQLMTVRSHSYSTVRRAVSGLISKMSIEHCKVTRSDAQQRCALYYALLPEEVFARRRAAGLLPYPRELNSARLNPALHIAAERIVHYSNLTRREAQIALCCIEGLTNSEIGKKLCVSEHTVKSHLRSVFTKLGVKRRAELVSQLLVRDSR